MLTDFSSQVNRLSNAGFTLVVIPGFTLIVILGLNSNNYPTLLSHSFISHFSGFTLIVIPLCFKVGYSLLFGHISRSSSYVVNFGYPGKSHHREGPITCCAILLHCNKFFLGRLIIPRVSVIFFICVVIKDLCYTVIHFIWKFDPRYLVIMIRMMVRSKDTGNKVIDIGLGEGDLVGGAAGSVKWLSAGC